MAPDYVTGHLGFLCYRTESNLSESFTQCLALTIVNIQLFFPLLPFFLLTLPLLLLSSLPLSPLLLLPPPSLRQKMMQEV